MNDRLILLPLDDRPPCFIFPQRIAAIAGIELEVAPRLLTGNFLQPGDTASLSAWLEEQAPQAEGLIAAADMLAYGGLVASRSPVVSLEEALQRVEVFSRIKKKNPAIRLLVASVIMRISITASDKKAALHYKKLIRYSELSWRVDSLRNESLRPEYEQLQKSIPAEVIQAYLEARQRNHAVNRRMIEMLADGTLQGLILLQEDASLAGPHLGEQARLRDLARDLRVERQVLIYPGADEGAQTLLGRWLNRSSPARICVVFTSNDGADRAAPYEDRPLRQTVENHLRAAGVQPTDLAACDAVFWVHTPCLHGETKLAAREIESLMNAGKIIGIADVRYPNGSDPELMNMLSENGVLPKLSAYAGWNTAGNTIGTTIAHLSAWLATQQTGPSASQIRAQEMFLWERLVDDWGYQRVLRPRIEKEARKNGLDPLNLGDAKSHVEQEIARRLDQWAWDLWVKGCWAAKAPRLEIHLPWPRTFEVEVTARALF